MGCQRDEVGRPLRNRWRRRPPTSDLRPPTRTGASCISRPGGWLSAALAAGDLYRPARTARRRGGVMAGASWRGPGCTDYSYGGFVFLWICSRRNVVCLGQRSSPSFSEFITSLRSTWYPERVRTCNVEHRVFVVEHRVTCITPPSCFTCLGLFSILLFQEQHVCRSVCMWGLCVSGCPHESKEISRLEYSGLKLKSKQFVLLFSVKFEDFFTCLSCFSLV